MDNPALDQPHRPNPARRFLLLWVAATMFGGTVGIVLLTTALRQPLIRSALPAVLLAQILVLPIAVMQWLALLNTVRLAWVWPLFSAIGAAAAVALAAWTGMANTLSPVVFIALMPFTLLQIAAMAVFLRALRAMLLIWLLLLPATILLTARIFVVLGFTPWRWDAAEGTQLLTVAANGLCFATPLALVSGIFFVMILWRRS